jgi:hypothetical protein
MTVDLEASTRQPRTQLAGERCVQEHAAAEHRGTVTRPGANAPADCRDELYHRRMKAPSPSRQVLDAGRRINDQRGAI